MDRRKRTIPVDIRIVTATNINLSELVKKGKFRDDLYYRINVFSIKIPPLRERMDDILPLGKDFLEKFNREFNRGIEGIDPDVVQIFQKYSWPGNVRELENVIKSAVILADDWIRAKHINGFLTSEAESIDLSLTTPLKDVTKLAEKRFIERVLADCKWNKRRAAQQLGVDYKTLYNKIKEYEIK